MSAQPATAPDRADWRELVAEGRGPRFALVCLGTWLSAAETLMTATVLPSVAHDIGGYTWFGWVTALYLAGAILSGATAGRLSLGLGLRRAMMLAGLVYALGCAACALAPTMSLFLAGRLLQGVGAGWVVGLSYVAVTALFPQRLWSLTFSAIAGVWGAATLISPLVGGLFAQSGFWRGAFWLFAAQGLGFIVAAMALVGPRIAAEAGPSPRPPVAALSVLTLAIVAVGAAGLTPRAAWTAVLGLAGCGLLVLFVRLNAAAEAPLLPRQAGDPGSAVGAGLALVFASGAATASFTVYGAALLQTLHGASPVLVGYILGGEAMTWTAAALLVAGRPDAGRWIRIGAGLVVVSVIAFALTTPHGSLATAAACALLQGTGFGLMWAFTSAGIVANAPPPEKALASSATPTTQMIGVAVGAAASGAIANLLGFGQGLTPARAETGGFWLFAAFAPVALAAFAAAWRLGKETR